ncbi:MAG: hypothetical protein CM15mP128_1210 [Methanobacteriota archaeon]|nr:MAG: hypothetical protein CM15mP128_1210 [Euryarchaeota archaeon]
MEQPCTPSAQLCWVPDVKAPLLIYVLFILSMNIIGESGDRQHLGGAHGEFATMVWVRIWLVSLPANVVFVWGSANGPVPFSS